MCVWSACDCACVCCMCVVVMRVFLVCCVYVCVFCVCCVRVCFVFVVCVYVYARVYLLNSSKVQQRIEKTHQQQETRPGS